MPVRIRRPVRVPLRVAAVLALAVVAAAPLTSVGASPGAQAAVAEPPRLSVIPAPTSVAAGTGAPVALGPGTVVKVLPGDAGAAAEGERLAAQLRRATGYAVPVGQRAAGQSGATIALSTTGAGLAKEAYRLESGNGRVEVTASTAEGLFRGTTTLLQLLPPQVESATPVDATGWQVPAVDIADSPRFEYRGSMLDVGRRFYPVGDVERYLDQMAKYKLNALHLHLTDDQGWRLSVDAYPELTAVGGRTQSGWAPGTGGPWFYTKADYQRIVKYAADRYIDVIPEVDGPGHTSAAKASLPQVNCDGKAIPPYYGFDVGLPPVCLEPRGHAAVTAYLQAVLEEAAQQSGSDVVHIGGDENPSVTREQMDWYVRTASKVVTDQGKRVMGWNQIGQGTLAPGSILQWWGLESDQRTIGTANESASVVQTRQGLAQGAQVVVSPADRSYLDMKYDGNSPYGLSWAGLVPLRRAYDWNPVSALARPDGSAGMVTEGQVLGVEAPLWADRAYAGSSQLPRSRDQFVDPKVYSDYMAFPRMPALAEVAWSTQESRSYDDFVRRTVDHAKRWDVMGIGYYKAPDIPWR
jgi:hexosaminidase